MNESASSWAQDIIDRDYKVSPEEKATMKNYLELSNPFLKDYDRVLDYARRAGIFNDEEYEKLLEAKRLFESAQIPMSLLDMIRKSEFTMDDLKNRD